MDIAQDGEACLVPKKSKKRVQRGAKKPGDPENGPNGPKNVHFNSQTERSGDQNGYLSDQDDDICVNKSPSSPGKPILKNAGRVQNSRNRIVGQHVGDLKEAETVEVLQGGD